MHKSWIRAGLDERRTHNSAVNEPSPQDLLAAHYSRLWDEAAPIVRAGQAAPDSWLARPEQDGRRGVTLLARPAAPVTATLSAFLEHLRTIEPAQRYQPASELHHTVLSLFTATVDHGPRMARLPDYLDAVSEVVAGTSPFPIDVRGVTLTPGAVLAQGFPRDDTLAVLRDKLRQAITARGLGGALDQRYRLVTAHMTIVRFATPLREPERFVAALEEARSTDFGSTHVEQLELVFGDWFHTQAREQVIRNFELR